MDTGHIHQNYLGLSVGVSYGCNTLSMRQAIGFTIVLYGLSQFFTTAFSQFDHTATQVLQTIGTAAIVTEQSLQPIK